MSRKMGELYNKAVRYHDEGELDKAIEVCEKAMSESLKNEAILNLKGIILYQKGMLDDAITVWNINREFNDNDIAKSYIKDSINDREKIELYKTSEFLLKKLEIDKAIELLNRCKKSDFNTIKVNTALGKCYLKKGMPKEAKEYLNEALIVNKNYKEAKGLIKEIDEIYGDNKRSNSNKKIYIITFLIAVLAGGGFGIYNMITKGEAKANLPSETAENKVEVQSKEEEKKAAEDKKEETAKETNLDTDKLNSAMKNNDYYSIASILGDLNVDNLKGEDKKLYDKAKKELKDEGVQKFYDNGQKYCNDKEYKKALDEFLIALPYSKGTYLNEHILYYLGVTESELKDNKEAIKYLEEYYKYFSDGSYVDEVLYRLALLNEKTNIDDSKLYARIIKDKYANSMYNNDKISKILGS